MRLPMSKEEITPVWLSQALAPHWPGVVVKDVELGQTILGSASKIRLHLDYADRAAHTNLPQTMWIKIGLGDFQHSVESILGVYAAETVAYGEVLPRYRVHRPDCYFHAAQKNPAQGILLLEDLVTKKAVFNSALSPLSRAQVACGLETLAALHAQSWNDPRLKQDDGILPVLTSPLRQFFEQWVNEAKKLFSVARGYAVPVVLHDTVRLRAAWDKYPALVHQGPQCFLHGDTHIGNSYLEPDGSIGFLDWQIASTGLWVHDFTYFLVTALDMPDRRRGERELLTSYLTALRRQVRRNGRRRAGDRLKCTLNRVPKVHRHQRCDLGALDLDRLARAGQLFANQSSFLGDPGSVAGEGDLYLCRYLAKRSATL